MKILSLKYGLPLLLFPLLCCPLMSFAPMPEGPEITSYHDFTFAEISSEKTDDDNYLIKYYIKNQGLGIVDLKESFFYYDSPSFNFTLSDCTVQDIRHLTPGECVNIEISVDSSIFDQYANVDFKLYGYQSEHVHKMEDVELQSFDCLYDEEALNYLNVAELYIDDSDLPRNRQYDAITTFASQTDNNFLVTSCYTIDTSRDNNYPAFFTFDSKNPVVEEDIYIKSVYFIDWESNYVPSFDSEDILRILSSILLVIISPIIIWVIGLIILIIVLVTTNKNK